jgi:flagellar hook assembly protein FlgD
MGVKVFVNSTNTSRVSINAQKRSTVRTIALSSLSSTSQNATFAALNDVDASNPNNNETVVYNSSTQKYEVKTLPIVDAGTF